MTELEQATLQNLQTQTHKAQAEIRALEQPFLLRLGSWITIIAGATGLVAGFVQFSNARHESNAAKLDEKLARIQAAEATRQAEIARKEKESAEEQLEKARATYSIIDQQAKERASQLSDIESKLNNAKNALAAQDTGLATKELSEARTKVSEAREANLNELLTAFLREVTAAGNSQDPAAALRFYAPKVNYFGHGDVDHSFIAKDRSRFVQHVSKRRYTFRSITRINPLNKDGLIEVEYTFDYFSENGSAKVISSEVRLRRVGNTFLIESIAEPKA